MDRGDGAPDLSILVPTRNAAPLVDRLLGSLAEPRARATFEVVINDAITSTDDTRSVVERWAARGLDARYLRANVSMAQARTEAARAARGRCLLHLDADMTVPEGLVDDVVDRLGRFDALVIDEQGAGSNFWGRAKALEKDLARGVEQLESARAWRRDVYDGLGGHNDDLVFSEDKDLDLRARHAALRIGRSHRAITHHEGAIRLRDTVRKKRFYAQTAPGYAAAHPEAFAWQANPLNRFRAYWPNRSAARGRTAEAAGLIVLKAAEFAGAGAGMALGRTAPLGKANWLLSTVENWPAAVAALRRGSGEVVLRTRDGKRLIARNGTTDAQEGVVVLGGRDYPRDLLTVPPGATIADIGANIGAFSVALDAANVHRAWRGLAVEPHPDNVALLRRNLTENDLTNIEVVPAAVSADGRTVSLDTGPVATGGYDAIRISERSEPTEPAELDEDALIVPSLTLGEVASRLGGAVTLLKLDVEGAEYEILEDVDAVLAANITRMLVEYHPRADGGDGLVWLRQRFAAHYLIAGVRRVATGPSGIAWLERRG